ASLSPAAPTIPHELTAIRPLHTARAEWMRLTEHSSQIAPSTIHERGALIVSKSRRVEECNHRDPPLDDIGAQVKPDAVLWIADFDTAFHQLRGARGRIAAKRVESGESACPVREGAITHAGGEPAISRRRR